MPPDSCKQRLIWRKNTNNSNSNSWTVKKNTYLSSFNKYLWQNNSMQITSVHTPWVLLVLATRATLSDSALALLGTARRAQLVPYRCSHYSSFLRRFAAHQTQLCWWCSPFLQVQRHISQENPPLTQIPRPSPTGPWSMTGLCLENAPHLPGERADVQTRASKERSHLGAPNEESGRNSAASLCSWKYLSQQVR